MSTKVGSIMRYAYRLLHPRVAFLLLTKFGNRINAMTLAWHTPVDYDLIALAVDRENYSYELIKKSGEFTLNVLDRLDVLWKAGTVSGRDVNKIELLGVELEKGVKIETPHVKDAMAYLECRVEREIEFEEHSLFVARIAFAYADKRFFKEIWLEGVRVPMHVGKDVFTTPSKYERVRESC